MKISSKVSDRISTNLKKFQPILDSAKARDVTEADTVTIIKDMLSDVFGYDKYSEITSELAIRGTYCDLAVKLDGKISLLIEAKAIGIDLKDQHIKQAVDYAANLGIDWVVLTNGIIWNVYHVIFSKPIDKELVVSFDATQLKTRLEKDLEVIYLLCKEGWQKSALTDFKSQQEALSRYTIGALLQSDSLLDVLKRELRRISPDIKIDEQSILDVLLNEVIKREVLEGDKAQKAQKDVAKASKTLLRRNAVSKNSESKDLTTEITGQ
jgi:predicted type IV restriction endonuclease